MAAILNFMADHPGQSFALTDLVRALKLSRATCHALLTGLVEVGYLYRTSDKSYVLGPGLANICQAVSDHFSPLQVAQPEMRTLADEYDVVCSAFFLEGEMVNVRERASSVSHVGISVQLGARLKLRVPFAATFFAWSAPEDVEAWLETMTPPPTPSEREALAQSMIFARRHGFVLFVTNPDSPELDRPPELVFGGDKADFPIKPAAELEPKQKYEVRSLLSPVFDANDKVAFVMGLMGFNRSMTGSEAAEVAGRLRAACGRITSYIGGHRGTMRR